MVRGFTFHCLVRTYCVSESLCGRISYRNSYLGLGIFCGISDPDEIRALFAIAMEREQEEVIGEIESVPLS